MPTEPTFTIRFLGETTFRGTSNRLKETLQPTSEGAMAALETFYYAFNERSLDLLHQIWLDHPLIQLNTPLGGIIRGAEPIGAGYARLFEGPVSVRGALSDIVAYFSSEMAVFAGQEHGTYEREGRVYPLDVRTSCIFLYAPDQGGWRQIYHQVSLDDPEMLAQYQRAILGS